ncbi:hypothetical protein CcCBS67573_g08714 [Chytriomyces confervae]|uniref:ATP synthase F(0) complex subunit e, mitochondrial n=1 Tax=Chytriomyces confervae TaxID=246404 RepID=A0A507EHQ1_9FUNG|nr:hypothetical protein CcCBS67573_g08714 [Chytriomyces confervae]
MAALNVASVNVRPPCPPSCPNTRYQIRHLRWITPCQSTHLPALFKQVARWSALAFGVFYGYSRQRSLTLHVKEQNEEKEFRAYADLVEEAKIAFEAAYNREQAVKAAPYGS